MSATCCSSCGCNNGSCGCGVTCQYIVDLRETTGQDYSFSNQNIGGIGVLDNVTGVNVGFRGISSANAMITVALDAPNKSVQLTLNSSAVAAAFPIATTTQVGVLETATNAEALIKSATDKALTPSNLLAMGSTTTFAGLVELATNAETQAGLSGALAVTPAGLASVTATLKNSVAFADAVARAAAVPTFEGQYGYQLDTNQPYVAFGTSAGNWSPMVAFGQTNTLSGNTTLNGTGATVTVNNAEFTLSGVVVGYTGSSSFTIDNSTILFENNTLNLTGNTVLIGGFTVPANEIIGTSGTPGDLDSFAISNFLSSYNVQTGYTPFLNPATERTCDTATVTLQQLAQIVGTLISDLKARNLPAT